ncbi:MAG: LysR family transcriptional regulator [Novosphingobium sp.]|nr:LysR family transcriptional regulator [Novosphingobium sp.]
MRKLRHALAIAECRNFSVAAERLNISQPALSRSIAALENAYGVRIFDRSRSGVFVTMMGQQILTQAEAILRLSRDLDHNMRLYGSGAAGTVRIGFNAMLASLLIPTLGRHVLSAMPQVNLRTDVRALSDLGRSLAANRDELIYCFDFQLAPSDDVMTEPIGSLPLGFIVRSGHPLAGKGPMEIDDLTGYPFISGSEVPHPLRSDASGDFTCNNMHILRDVAHDSDGIWLVTPRFVARELAAGTFVELAVTDKHIPITLPVVQGRLTGRSLSPAAAAVAQVIAGSLSAAPGSQDSA